MHSTALPGKQRRIVARMAAAIIFADNAEQNGRAMNIARAALPLIFTAMMFTTLAGGQPIGQMVTKTETFDRDPNWEGLNHRAAKPRKIQQDFGYSNGKIGGVITIAGEPAYYAKNFPREPSMIL